MVSRMGLWSSEPGLTLEQRTARLRDPELIRFLFESPDSEVKALLGDFILARVDRFGECEAADYIDLVTTFVDADTPVHIVVEKHTDEDPEKEYLYERLEPVATSDHVYKA